MSQSLNLAQQCTRSQQCDDTVEPSFVLFYFFYSNRVPSLCWRWIRWQMLRWWGGGGEEEESIKTPLLCFSLSSEFQQALTFPPHDSSYLLKTNKQTTTRCNKGEWTPHRSSSNYYRLRPMWELSCSLLLRQDICCAAQWMTHCCSRSFVAFSFIWL